MQEREPLSPITGSRQEILEEAVSSYQAGLDTRAAQWLSDRLGGKENALKVAATHRLGVVSDPEPGHYRFQGMLAIPYLDKHGKPLTLRFRCVEEHDHRANFHGKMNSLTDDPSRIYNVRAVLEAESEIHVTEGEPDAWVLNLLGYPAIAIPGVHNWKFHHARVLAGFNRVCLWADPDEAGDELVQKVTKAVRAAKPMKLDKRIGDVNDHFLKGGADLIREVHERSTR